MNRQSFNPTIPQFTKMHATAYLKAPEKHETGPLAVLYGPERYLKHEALKALTRVVLGADEEDDAGPTVFTGKDVDLKTVCDELLTVSMWGERRLVVVDDADEFVTRHRAGLEKYLDKPARKSVLVLVVRSWPKTTRLAKAVAKAGLDLECGALKGQPLARWLTDLARDEHGKQLTREAAVLMAELAGTELGLLGQELSKLAAYVGDRSRIGPEDVRALVGGWKAETAFAMIDALRDGDLGTALAHLDRLLAAGEAPQRTLGAIVYTFRKLAQATEDARHGTPLHAALKQTGLFPNVVPQFAQYLRRIGRPRAEAFYTLLLETDGRLKGASRAPERFALERLLVELSGDLLSN